MELDDFYTKQKIFEFNSVDQRMSVIVERDSKKGEYEIYCKGNPEKMKILCKKETLPINYDSHLEYLSKMGYRVLAIASANLDTLDIKRTEAEQNLEFLGLLVLENKLKEKTEEIIKKLNRADILSVMITGDNINTACAIAMDCHILDNHKEIFEVHFENSEIVKRPCKKLQAAYDLEEEDPDRFSQKRDLHRTFINDINHKPKLVIKGKTFHEIFQKFTKSLNPKKALRSDEFRDILTHCRVYARTTPEQKQQIVSLLKLLKEEEDTLVGFCGDGANDTLALKEADIGLSLSQDDASLAAPFVSTDTELTSVENLIIEGRGAIACSFQNFKFFLYVSLA